MLNKHNVYIIDNLSITILFIIHICLNLNSNAYDYEFFESIIFISAKNVTEIKFDSLI